MKATSHWLAWSRSLSLGTRQQAHSAKSGYSDAGALLSEALGLLYWELGKDDEEPDDEIPKCGEKPGNKS